MKKNFKRTLAKVMAVALTVAVAGTAAPEADAAKKIKLSKKSITVTKGTTTKVTIKNVKAKKVKKLTVKSNKKKIATVKKAGKTAFKVTGKKKGNAKITVKVTVKGKKKATKLTLKVKVTNKKVADKVTSTNAPSNNVTPTPAGSNATAAPGGNTATADPNASADPNTTAAPNTTADPNTTAVPGTVDTEIITPESDSVKVTLSADTEHVATKDKTGYRDDVEFNDDGSVTFTTKGQQYNAGMMFYVDASQKMVDLTAYPYLRIEVENNDETMVKLFSKTTSIWSGEVSAGGKFEGETYLNKESATKRVWTIDLSAMAEEGNLEGVQGIFIGNKNVDKEITVYSMEFFKENPDVVKPEATIETIATDMVSTESQVVEVGVSTDAKIKSVAWATSDATVVETSAVEADNSAKVKLNAKKVGKATVTAVVTLEDGTELKVEKEILVNPITPTGDTYSVLVSSTNEGGGTKGKDSFRMDVQDVADGVSYTAVKGTNAGMIFYADANKGWVDFSAYKYLKVVVSTSTENEIFVKVKADADNYWGGDLTAFYEGGAKTGERTIYCEITDDNMDLLASVSGINITPKNGDNGTVTVKAIEFVNSKDATTGEEEEETNEPVVYTVNQSATIETTGTEMKAWKQNATIDLSTPITVKSTDTVSVKVSVKTDDVADTTSTFSVDLSTSTSSDNLYGGRIMGTGVKSAGNNAVTLLDGKSITDSVQIKGIWIQNASDIAGSKTVITIESITVTPAAE